MIGMVLFSEVCVLCSCFYGGLCLLFREVCCVLVFMGFMPFVPFLGSVLEKARVDLRMSAASFCRDASRQAEIEAHEQNRHALRFRLEELQQQRDAVEAKLQVERQQAELERLETEAKRAQQEKDTRDKQKQAIDDMKRERSVELRSQMRFVYTRPLFLCPVLTVWLCNAHYCMHTKGTFPTAATLGRGKAKARRGILQTATDGSKPASCRLPRILPAHERDAETVRQNGLGTGKGTKGDESHHVG